MLIQVFISLFIAVILMLVIVGKQTHAANAGKKLVLIGFALLMFLAVLFPDATTWVAKIMGVGRGADLLLYGLALTFIGYVANDYLRRQRERDTVIRLARKVALLDAETRYRLRQGKP